MKAVSITVWGDVQGVSYRYYAKKEAKALEITGFARNEHDGVVKMFVQGGEERVDSFLTWAKEGSPMATVEKVEVKEVEVNEGIKEFEVK